LQEFRVKWVSGLWQYQRMKKFAALLIIAVFVYGYVQDQDVTLPWSSSPVGHDSILLDAFNNKQSNLQVQGEGVVTRMLKDDLEGSRHQRFLLTLGSGQTVLISHNIDLAPRIEGLGTGDSVQFFGEYEWNSKGGVIHWTHRDPGGRHVAGWLKHQGRTYQ
jgi:hypothetical protein